MSSLHIGLNLSKKSTRHGPKPAPAKSKSVFRHDDDEDDDDEDQDTNGTHGAFAKSRPKPSAAQQITTFDQDSPPPNTTAKSPPPAARPPPHKPASSKPTLKSKFPSPYHSESSPNLATLRSQTLQTADVDPSLYDYDAAHDAFQSRSKAARPQASGSAANPDSDQSYMSDLLAAAEQRKKDQLRAKDRLLQKEREAEGEEYKDKDMFVTEAYKAQQAELRQAEQLEQQQEERQNKRRQQGLGMTNFYQGLMAEQEKQHQELVDAAADPQRARQAAAAADDEPAEKSDLQVARDLQAQGKDVTINQEGQVLDKRELLSAGLNVAPKPKRAAADAAAQAHNLARRDGPGSQAAAGRGDARKAMRERQSRMMEEQLEQAAKRAAQDEADEREKVERAAKSRKTEADVSSARERYLQRKREAAEAAGAK